MSVSNIFLNTYNPGNIRFSKDNSWIGQIGQFKGFCKFVDQIYGIRALMCLLRNYIFMGNSVISSIVNRFAPSSENDTKAYIDYVEDMFLAEGFSPYTSIDVKSRQFFILVKCICFYETGFVLTQEEFNYVCSRFGF